MSYYVYLHLDINKVVRYVGKGAGPRAYSKAFRSKKWCYLFSESPPEVIIVKTDLSNDEALTLEELLITKHSATIINRKKAGRVKELNFEELNERLYVSNESKTGLKWRNTKSFRIKNGDDAGSSRVSNGKTYYDVTINRKVYQAHRVVYLLAHGVLCSNLVINHIDGDSTNNSISNLEAITQRENILKRKMSKNNLSGVNGVYARYHKGILKGFLAGFPTSSHKSKSKLFSLFKYTSEEECLAAAKSYQQSQIDLILENIKKENDARK
jgi:hypothetical protein